jgi:orotidine-5'-phosphate decarboxylase
MSNQPRPTHAADRLIAAIEKKRSPVCVGLDPVIEKLPKALLNRPEEHLKDPLRAYMFCMEMLAPMQPYIPCIKLQSACFERFGIRSHGIPYRIIGHAKQLGFEVILDAKRGDIGVSAEHYAAASFETHPVDDSTSLAPTDWLTINSYLGEDGITPFLREGHGAFALVRTSNPGGDQVQNLELKDGRTVAHAVGEMVARIGSKHVGERGYSSLGAVVGATKPQDAKRLREIMPQQMFLVPGYGAQGAGLDDILPCFKSGGGGAIVTASRSVIYAFKPDDPKWMDSVADAAAKFADEVGRAVGMR